MSLIKEALDKVQEEGTRKESSPEDVAPTETKEPTGDRTAEEGRQLDLSTVITSVVIVILAALIGGQMVLLMSMFVF